MAPTDDIEALSLLIKQLEGKGHDTRGLDRDWLRTACDDVFTRFAGDRPKGIGVRQAGHVVADMHRKLGLVVPPESRLQVALLQCATGGSYALGREEFGNFVEALITPRDANGPAQGAACRQDAAAAVPPAGHIAVRVQKMDGTVATVEVDDRQSLCALKEEVERKLKVPACRQRLLLGTAILDGERPLHAQGVAPGASLTLVVGKPPPATFLRIRRVNLGDTSDPRLAVPRGPCAPRPSSLPIPRFGAGALAAKLRRPLRP